MYQTENGLIRHDCKIKNRVMAKDEKVQRHAFNFYSKFFEKNFRKKVSDYMVFVKSRYYESFVKFAKYTLDVQAIHPEAFMEFLIKAKVPIDKWTQDFVYEQYVRELNKKETPDAAVERTILLFQQWEQSSGEPWYDFFRKIHPNIAVNYIRSGRISPWILYSAPSSTELFARMSDEQLTIISKYVDPTFWGYKFSQDKEYSEFITTVLREYGL